MKADQERRFFDLASAVLRELTPDGPHGALWKQAGGCLFRDFETEPLDPQELAHIQKLVKERGWDNDLPKPDHEHEWEFEPEQTLRSRCVHCGTRRTTFHATTDLGSVTL